MYLRDKTINGHTYLYLVESVREGTRTKQRITLLATRLVNARRDLLPSQFARPQR